MLYALGSPTSFVVLLASFAVAVTLHGWVQGWAAARAGDRQPALQGRLRPDPRRQVDPFGAVGAAVSGTGWSRQVEPAHRWTAARVVPVLLAGAVANAVVGVGALLGYRAAGGPQVGERMRLLQTGVDGLDLHLTVLLLFGLSNIAVAALALVPIPPLPAGRVLFAVGPRSPGWQKARYHLEEQNIGTAVLLALLLIPLGGPLPLLPTLLDTVLGPALGPVLGG